MPSHPAIAGFRQRLRAGEPLTGIFLKTPSIEFIELLAMAGLDWVCLDGEHAPIDRRSMDAPLAMARALGLPAVVRVPVAAPDAILQALDCGAVGVLIPHINSVAKAEEAARWSHFGEGGRGYAGSTRWAGFAGTSIADNLARDKAETVVMAQIEDAAALDCLDGIAAVAGIDSLFVGPADFAVALGADSPTAPAVLAAYDRVVAAAKTHGLAVSTFAATPDLAKKLQKQGVSAFLIGSEHNLVLDGARNLRLRFHAA